MAMSMRQLRAPYDDAVDGRVRRRQLDGGGLERHAVCRAVLPQRDGPLQHRLGRGGVVVLRAGSGVGEQPRVVDPADDDADAVVQAERQQVPQRGLFQQGVPPRDQDVVDAGVRDELGEQPAVVHADADGPDHPRGAQRQQFLKRLVERGAEVVVGIVDVDEVHGVHAEPVQARRERGRDPLRGEVGMLRAVVVEQPADLRGDDHLCPVGVAQRPAQATLGQSGTVTGSHVEQPDAEVEGAVHRGQRLRIGEPLVQVADRRAAEAEGGQVKGVGPLWRAEARHRVSSSGRAGTCAVGGEAAGSCLAGGLPDRSLRRRPGRTPPTGRWRCGWRSGATRRRRQRSRSGRWTATSG